MEPANRKGPRGPYSMEQRQHLLLEFKQSGMSVREFSRIHSINESTLGKWLARAREKGTNEPGRPGRKRGKQQSVPSEQAGFAALQITRSSDVVAKSASYAEVRVIKIYQPVSAAYIKELQ